MAAEMYDGGDSAKKPTRGAGNAGGKPIRPILFGVGAVIALILVSLAISRSSQKVTPETSDSGSLTGANYSRTRSSHTAIGRESANGYSDSASRPATAPMNSAGDGNASTSVSGSSSLPVPGAPPSSGRMASPGVISDSAGQNFVAPPGPAVNQQGTNR